MDSQIQPMSGSKRSSDSKSNHSSSQSKPNQVSTVLLYGIPIVSLFIESQERLCLAQISNTLLKQFSYNEIHNRRVALGITCVQCTPVQLEILRRAGAMPVSSRRCGMITRREAERLCKSFLGDNAPPRLPDDFAFSVHHECAWGCRGSFLPSRYNSSRAKCIKCSYCGLFFSPNKFIFHSHRIGPGDKYIQPDAANFNSWRRHMKLSGSPPDEITHAWEDVKAMFNGGTRKRLVSGSPTESISPQSSNQSPKRIKISSSSPASSISQPTTPQSIQSLSPPYSNLKPIIPHSNSNLVSNVPTLNPSRLSTLGSELPLPFPRSFMMDYMWHHQNNQAGKHPQASINGLSSPPQNSAFPLPPYALPWLKRPLFFHHSPNHTTPNNSSETEGQVASNPGSYLESKTFNFYNNSAFKPVLNNQNLNNHLKIGAEEEPSTPVLIKEPMSSDEDGVNNHDDEENDDDILVDIETTEEEEVLRRKSPKVKPEDSLDVLPSDNNNNTSENYAKRSPKLLSPSSLHLKDRLSPVVEPVPSSSPAGVPTPSISSNGGSGELWSVARLTRPLENNSHFSPLSTRFQGENLIIRTPEHSPLRPHLTSLPPHHQLLGSPSQARVAHTLYQHGYAKHFQIYRNHPLDTASPPQQTNGIV